MSMMRTLILFIILAGIASACGTFTNLTVKYDKKVNFDDYKSYAWLPDENKSGNNDFDNDLIRQRIRNYIGHCLKEHQYRVDTLSPDLLLRVKWMAQAREMNYPYITEQPFYYDNVYYEDSFAFRLSGRSEYYQGNAFTNTGEKLKYYHNGLEVTFIDTKTNAVIWNGFTSDDIYDPKVIYLELHPSIHKMMKRLPFQTQN